MQILKIVFLIISLTAFQGCKKEKDSDESTSQQLSQDYDGDLITNNYDDEPFIVNNPMELIEVESMLDNEEKYHFEINHFSKSEIFKHLALHFRDSDIKLAVNVKPSTRGIKAMPAGSTKMITSVKLDTLIKNLQFEIKSKMRTLFSKTITKSEDIISLLSSNDLIGQNLTLDIKDFEFQSSSVSFTYQEFKKSVSKKSFRLSIIDDAAVRSVQISNQLNLMQALDLLGYSNMEIEKMTGRNDALFTTDLAFLKPSEFAWVPINWNHETKIAADSHIILIKTKVKDLMDNFQRSSNSQNSFFEPQFSYQLKGIKKLRLNLSGTLTYRKQITQSIQATTYYMQKHKKCYFLKKEIKRVNHSFNLSNIRDYFDFYLDNKKINPKWDINRTHLIFNNSNNVQKLTLKLKPTFNHKVFTGRERIVPARRNYPCNGSTRVHDYEATYEFKIKQHNSIERIKINSTEQREYLLH